MVFIRQLAMLLKCRNFKTRQLFLNFLLGILLGSLVTYIGTKCLKESLVDTVTVFRKAIIYSNDYYDDEELQTSDVHTAWRGDARSLSNWISPRVRILCWILTSPETLQEKASHVKATWARRCNTVLFISSEDTDFPTIAVNVDHEDRDYLWQKTKGAFSYIYKHYLDKADWFLKADDDTYVVVENLRKLLHKYDTEKPIFFGRKFKFRGKIGKQPYMQGGAGYVLSRKALEVLVERGFKNKVYARISKWNPGEDLMISMLLFEEGVEDGYSRDGIHETFHAVSPEEAIVPDMDPYAIHNYFEVKQGPECCSDYTISFHHVTPETMYWLEYMVYRLRPFGVGYYECPDDIRTIVGLKELPLTGPVNVTEGQSIINVKNRENSTIQKSEKELKLKPERKRNQRRKKTTNMDAADASEQQSVEKMKSKKKRNSRRKKKQREEKDDVRKKNDMEEEEEEKE